MPSSHLGADSDASHRRIAIQSAVYIMGLAVEMGMWKTSSTPTTKNGTRKRLSVESPPPVVTDNVSTDLGLR